MKRIAEQVELVSTPRTLVPIGADQIVIRTPGPAQVMLFDRPLTDVRIRLDAAREARANPPEGADLRALRLAAERAEEWHAYAVAWRALRMIDDPAWQVDALDALDRGDLERGDYPELQYGAAFLEELHEHLDHDAAAVWAFLGHVGKCTTRSGVKARIAEEAQKLAASFREGVGAGGSDDPGPALEVAAADRA